MKQQTALPFPKSSLFLLAVFLLPLLAKDVHYLFAHSHHDHHIHHCDVEGVHLHDPEHYTPENCSLCGVVYAYFFNDSALLFLSIPALPVMSPDIWYLQTDFSVPVDAIHLRGPPATA